jgi:hypothetical protein
MKEELLPILIIKAFLEPIFIIDSKPIFESIPKVEENNKLLVIISPFLFTLLLNIFQSVFDNEPDDDVDDNYNVIIPVDLLYDIPLEMDVLSIQIDDLDRSLVKYKLIPSIILEVDILELLISILLLKFMIDFVFPILINEALLLPIFNIELILLITVSIP